MISKTLLAFILVIVIFPISASAIKGENYGENLIYSVQSSLLSLDYDPGPIDGMWGLKTEAAIKDFQRQNGLSVTGNLDEMTIKILSPQKNIKHEGTKTIKGEVISIWDKLMSLPSLKIVLLMLIVATIVSLKLFLNLSREFNSTKEINRKKIEEEIEAKIETIIKDELINLLGKRLDNKIKNEFKGLAKPYIEKSLRDEIPDHLASSIKERLNGSFNNILNNKVHERVNNLLKDKEITDLIKNAISVMVVEKQKVYDAPKFSPPPREDVFKEIKAGGCSSSPL